MKICEKKLEEFLFDDKIYHNDVSVEGYGFRAGFTAALEWVLFNMKRGGTLENIHYNILKEVENINEWEVE